MGIVKKAVRESTAFLRRPKTPGQTPEELELEERQRSELNKLTRETNVRLKAVKRGRAGRRSLLGSGSELGVAGIAGGGVRGGTGTAARVRGGGGGRGGSRAVTRARTTGGILGSVR